MNKENSDEKEHFNNSPEIQLTIQIQIQIQIQ